MTDPLHQFELHTLIPLKLGVFDISITNATIFMFLAAVLSIVLPYIAIKKGRVIPNMGQSIYESMIEFISSFQLQYAGSLDYFPFIVSIFTFILFSNLLGVIPGAFTTTSHISSVLSLALFVYGTIITLSIMKKGLGFFRLFFPETIPVYLAPLFIPIEIVSFIFKPFSLSIRLFANMVAGHIVVKLFAGFVIALLSIKWLFPFAIVPLTINVFLVGLEFVIACLQAYVFSVLSCIYIHEMSEGH